MSDGGPSTRQLLGLLGWGLLFLGLAIWSGQRVFGGGEGGALVGQPAPAFEGVITAGEGSEGGDRVSLAALRGQPVLLEFWASWCPPCRASVPIVSRLATRHAGAGLVALGVNIEHGRNSAFVERAHEAFGFRFPTLHDQNGAMQSAFAVSSIPTLLLIDRSGVVRHVELGVPSEAELEAQVVELLEENH